jgi:hypothetical protein
MVKAAGAGPVLRRSFRLEILPGISRGPASGDADLRAMPHKPLFRNEQGAAPHTKVGGISHEGQAIGDLRFTRATPRLRERDVRPAHTTVHVAPAYRSSDAASDSRSIIETLSTSGRTPVPVRYRCSTN